MSEEARSRRVSNLGDLIERSIELGLGAMLLTAEGAQKLVNDMVSRGHVAREESTSMVERLMSMGRVQREQMRDMIEKTTERAMDRMHIAREDDVEALRQRVNALERIVLGRIETAGEPPAPLEGKDFLLDQE